MLTLTKGFGNNSNILFQNLHLHAFCIQNNIEFTNPFVKKYRGIFPLLNECFDFNESKYLLKIKSIFSKNFNNPDLESSYKAWLLQRMDSNTWVKGWSFRAYEEVVAQKLFFQKIFTPIFDEKIKEQLAPYKKEGKLLSVHIRRGDYRQWQGGKYFFSDFDYLSAIKKVLNEDASIATVSIYSNETIDLSLYKNLNAKVICVQNSWCEDQWKMAQSDLIIGPPSTFSLWASFIGDVPLWHIEDKTSNPSYKISNG